MNYIQIFNKLVKENPNEVFEQFLKALQALFQEFLNGKVDEITVSDITVFWYATSEEFSDALIKIDSRIERLARAMDITHPDFSFEKKRELIGEHLDVINDILADQ